MATATPSQPTPTIRGLPRPLVRALEAYADRLDVEKIREAYDLAVKAHGGQTRASGEEYVTHTVEVATLLAQFRLDSNSIIEGLIYDTVEDTDISLKDLESRFGSEVARSGGENEVDEALTWFRQVLEWQQDTAEPEEFMEYLRMDLFRGEIFVFAPDRNVQALPNGATPDRHRVLRAHGARSPVGLPIASDRSAQLVEVAPHSVPKPPERWSGESFDGLPD